jgi:prepilin-type N-terminal cleavage/methylation domain-containing protein
MRQKGFTLVELLVAIGIIGILSSIAVVSVSNVRAKARDAKRLADVKQIQTALEAYLNDMGKYPQTSTNGTTAIGKTSVTTDTDMDKLCNTTAGFSSAACAETTYLNPVPGNPTPHAGDTATIKDEYLYRSKDNATPAVDCTADTQTCASYSIIFKLESGAGTYAKGMYEANENGIVSKGLITADPPAWP